MPLRLALSPDEAAAALGVSRDFLDEHVAPELRWVRRGRRKFVAIRELERWLEQAGRVDAGGGAVSGGCAMARAGHSDFATTQLYIDLSGEAFREEAERLERRLWGETGTKFGYTGRDGVASTGNRKHA